MLKNNIKTKLVGNYQKSKRNNSIKIKIKDIHRKILL